MTDQHQITPRASSESCNAMTKGKISMKQIKTVSALVLVSILCACSTGVDKDGVPQVDLHGIIVVSNDPAALKFQKNWGGHLPAKRMLTVGKEQITLSTFILTYCKGMDANATCAHAKTISSLDAMSGPMANLPNGL